MEVNEIEVQPKQTFEEKGFAIQLNRCQLEGTCKELNRLSPASKTMVTDQRPRLMRYNTYDASKFRNKLLKFPSKTDETLLKFRKAFSELKSYKRSNSDYIGKSIIELQDVCKQVRNLTCKIERYDNRLNEIQASVIDLRRLYFRQQEDKMRTMLESAALREKIKDITVDLSTREQQCCSLF